MMTRGERKRRKGRLGPDDEFVPDLLCGSIIFFLMLPPSFAHSSSCSFSLSLSFTAACQAALRIRSRVAALSPSPPTSSSSSSPPLLLLASHPFPDLMHLLSLSRSHTHTHSHTLTCNPDGGRESERKGEREGEGDEDSSPHESRVASRATTFQNWSLLSSSCLSFSSLFPHSGRPFAHFVSLTCTCVRACSPRIPLILACIRVA